MRNQTLLALVTEASCQVIHFVIHASLGFHSRPLKKVCREHHEIPVYDDKGTKEQRGAPKEESRERSTNRRGCSRARGRTSRVISTEISRNTSTQNPGPGFSLSPSPADARGVRAAPRCARPPSPEHDRRGRRRRRRRRGGRGQVIVPALAHTAFAPARRGTERE